jgi:hypothetical protein
MGLYDVLVICDKMLSGDEIRHGARAVLPLQRQGRYKENNNGGHRLPASRDG